MRVRQSLQCRPAFTLVELLVAIAIILVLSALTAAFMPRVSDSQNLSRAVDQLEQWLLTAKMRAKRDGLATGIRFIGTAGLYPQFQYIQQPGPLTGGTPTGAVSGTPTFKGGYCAGVSTLAAVTTVAFGNVDFSLGGTLQAEGWLVQQGDYLELRNGGGVHYITGVPTANHLTVSATSQSIVLAAPTANYRILRQPRLLTGENPLTLPNNFAVDTRIIPGPVASLVPPIPANAIIPGNTTIAWSNVQNGSSVLPEILFSPTGAVIGNNASNGKVLLSVYDTTMDPFDISRVGVIAIQCRTGYIGAYSMSPGADPFYFAENGRESGL